MKIYKDIEQWTEEWYNIRKFKMTASNAWTMMVMWKWFDMYLLKLVATSYSKWQSNGYSNSHMERWNELEPLAREIYELETWNQVEEVWFIEHNDYVWCSPDWLIWEDGWIEIKCMMDEKYFWHIMWTEDLDKWHIMQIQMCLLITWRKWWDYCLYNPNYEKTIIIKRIYPDENVFRKLKEAFIIWENTIKKYITEYEKRKILL